MQDEIIAEAHALYSAGLNILPIQVASKEPYGSTSILQTTRIHTSFIDHLFTESGIGVMTGRLSGNLFVIDCDDDDTYEYVGEQLRQRRISAWIRLGMRGGQYWLRCAEGEVENFKQGKLQVLGHGLYAVAPPSLHPEGVFYHWLHRDVDLPPSVSIRQLDFLGLKLAGSQRSGPKRDKTTLPPAAYRVLVEEDTSGYDSNSEAEYAACLSMLRAGLPDFMIRSVFAQFHPPHYSKSRGRSFDRHVLRSAKAWMEQQDQKPQEREPMAFWQASQFVAYADSRPWPGRTGNTDKAVYMALCERMRMDKGSRVFRASIREVSELANVGTQAVQNSLKRLRTADMAKYDSKDSLSGACLYSLVLPVKDMSPITTVGEAYTPVADSVMISAIQEDAFHSRGLGKSACAIWRVLLLEQRPLTVKEIALLTGRAYNTVKQNLTKLETFGLAVQNHDPTPKRWTGIPAHHDRLNELAVILGTQGKGALRKAQHVGERQKWVSTMLLGQKDRFLARMKASLGGE
jgi:hypothetical protein